MGKRKPSTPRGAPAAKRKRTKGDTETEDSHEDESSAQLGSAKKRRGRPRKSQAKAEESSEDVGQRQRGDAILTADTSARVTVKPSHDDRHRQQYNTEHFTNISAATHTSTDINVDATKLKETLSAAFDSGATAEERRRAQEDAAVATERASVAAAEATKEASVAAERAAAAEVVDKSAEHLGRFAESRAAAEHAGLRVMSPTLVLPAHCDWFKLDRIDARERRAMPEFFDQSSSALTPEVYAEYRNFMVLAYQQNPRQYLTQTACRRNLRGDVTSVLRVHQFLELWALINFWVAPTDTLGVASSLPLVSAGLAPFEELVSIAQHSQTVSLTAAAPAQLSTRLDRVHAAGADSEAREARGPHEKASSAVGGATPRAAGARADADGIARAAQLRAKGIVAPKAVACGQCKQDCSFLYYGTVAKAQASADEAAASGKTIEKVRSEAEAATLKARGELVRCPQCYLQGLFPDTFHSGNFVRIDHTQSATEVAEQYAGVWTDQETLALLEALEVYSDNWNAVAKHVGTKTRKQCVLHFLRLPIEEPYLDAPNLAQAHEPARDYKEIASVAAGASAGQSIPFSGSDNPLLQLVAFLGKVAGDEVAGAAARAAVEAVAPVLRDEDGAPRIENADAPLGDAEIQTACSAAIGAVAAKSLALAQREAKEIRMLALSLVSKKMSQIEEKLKAFEELEAEILKERAGVEEERLRLVRERLAFAKEQREKEVTESVSADKATPMETKESTPAVVTPIGQLSKKIEYKFTLSAQPKE